MKTVLLTGASGGLGLALSKKLIESGYFVILHYFRHQEEVLKIHESYPNQTFLIQGDVSKEANIEKMKRILSFKNFSIDILINNAAIDSVSELEEKTTETFMNVFLVNTVGPFFMIRHFGNEIQERRGVILNISSDNAIDMYDIVTLEYDTSKVSLNLMTKTFAKYYKKAHVNAICFGWLDTPMNDIPENIKKEMHFVPMETATNAIIELLNKDVTGQIELVR